ncbi:hypothetical protein [Kocuria sp.]|uniref:hypothetical protein n=1 Tax=Kocuria sp. TaxID=1871328 RepID=UPI0026DF0074|nr:hypothetical protein [Kocuria sp.]MDO5617615.1 hypothetical protein [Kocuria sp.]
MPKDSTPAGAHAPAYGPDVVDAYAGSITEPTHDEDPVRTLPVCPHGQSLDQQYASQDSMAPSPVLTLGPHRRRSLVAMRTALAMVFVLCLALDLGGVAQQRPQASLLERAIELGSPAFLGQVALGAMFVLTGILTTHYYLRRSPRGVWGQLVAQTAATLAATVIPGLFLAAVLHDVAAPSTVFKVLATILPAWVVGSVVIAVVFRTHWAKANITRIAPVLMVTSMVVSFVVGVNLSQHSPAVGTALWVDPEFSWAQTAICLAHLCTYFFAGTFVVSIGDGLLRRRTLFRVLVPVLGVVVFVLALPMAMAGFDVGQPFFALAILPVVVIPMPAILMGRDLWLGLVLYGWPVYLVLLAVGAAAWPAVVTAVVVVVASVLLAGLSWRHLQRPLVKKLTRHAPVAPRHRVKPDAEEPAEPRSARFRLLEVAEGQRVS